MGHMFDCYEKKLQNLSSDDSVIGVMLVGKGANVEFSNFESLNDVDLIVLTNVGEKNRRSVECIEGVDFDMSYLPLTFVEQAIRERNTLWLEILASGRIVYSDGIDEVIDRCEKIWTDGPGELRPIDKEYWSFYITTSLEDIHNRMDDEALAKYLITELLTVIMRAVFRLNNRFEPLKKKRWIGQIKDLDLSLGLEIEEVLVQTSAKDQLKIVETLYSNFIERLGGPCSTWAHEEFPEV